MVLNFLKLFLFFRNFLAHRFEATDEERKVEGIHYMSVLEQGVPEIRAPPTCTLTSPYFWHTPMT